MLVTGVPQFVGQPAWFGKLPSESEFFSRRILPDFDSTIEEWMRERGVEKVEDIASMLEV